jgi:hypothetical protein
LDLAKTVFLVLFGAATDQAGRRKMMLSSAMSFRKLQMYHRGATLRHAPMIAELLTRIRQCAGQEL